MWLCALQHMKPRACKLWPFKVHNEPKYGRPDHALYDLDDKRFYVYVDPACVGITWGNPTHEFVYGTLREFVEISLGFCEKQFYTTAQLEKRVFPLGYLDLERDFRRMV